MHDAVAADNERGGHGMDAVEPRQRSLPHQPIVHFRPWDIESVQVTEQRIQLPRFVQRDTDYLETLGAVFSTDRLNLRQFLRAWIEKRRSEAENNDLVLQVLLADRRAVDVAKPHRPSLTGRLSSRRISLFA